MICNSANAENGGPEGMGIWNPNCAGGIGVFGDKPAGNLNALGTREKNFAERMSAGFTAGLEHFHQCSRPDTS